MLSGRMLRDAIISGANHISNQRQIVDALNVFPVPDGDTGTNMSMTIAAARRELERAGENVTASETANIAAAALLRGARGNSGVILSLLFRGFSKGLRGKEQANAADVCSALSMGVEAAYKAVMKPTEGTILTVARVASEKAKEALRTNPSMGVNPLWKVILAAAAQALRETPEILPVLKKAGVVDAGGQGLLFIFEGMGSVFFDNRVIPSAEEAGKARSKTEFDDGFRNAAGAFDGEITFSYCTEFIVNKGENGKEPIKLRAYLESIGDSVVVVDDEDIIKCHVHTDNPGNALQEALTFGYLTNIKIENMREQHAAQRESARREQEDSRQKEGGELAYVPVDPSVEYGFVAVAAGEGIRQLFLDLGVNQVVSGGQTMNPSTNDILKAIHATPAKTVFVLPNNKNIIMAAEQTVKLADRSVYVLPTKTIPQGLSAMLAFDGDAAMGENQLAMTKALKRVGTGQVTFAARDSDFDGYKIRQGEILALEDGKLAFTEKDLTKACVKLTRSLVRACRDCSFISIIYGKDVTEEAAAKVEAAIRSKAPNNVEVALIRGDQPVYYYIISVE
ncbi:MAG: DAK2 domain-containing protein [Oscillospiraceae bacterium]|nr:DAK2 domain-containing protein [Oscillospiraceae bacterium]